MLHQIREAGRENVDGDRRDKSLARGRVPLNALRRFGRQFCRSHGVFGTEQLAAIVFDVAVVVVVNVGCCFCLRQESRGSGTHKQM